MDVVIQVKEKSITNIFGKLNYLQSFCNGG